MDHKKNIHHYFIIVVAILLIKESKNLDSLGFFGIIYSGSCLLFQYWEDAERKREILKAERERLRNEFSMPWHTKIDVLTSSDSAKILEKELQELECINEWKTPLIQRLLAKISSLHYKERLEEFRIKSQNPNSYPLNSLFIYNLPESPGIYRIFNTVNNRSYIGESRNICKRISVHLEKLEKGYHKKKLSDEESNNIQDDFFEFGSDNFGVEVLETFKRDLIKQRHSKEAEYISKFRAVEHGYNQKHNESWTKETINFALRQLANGSIEENRINGLLNACKQVNLTESQKNIIDKYISKNQLKSCGNTSRIIWTKDKILEVSMKCSTRNELRVNYPKAYDAARRHNCLDEVCAHMSPPKSSGSRKKSA